MKKLNCLLTNMCMEMYEPYEPSEKSILWYKTLSFEQIVT